MKSPFSYPNSLHRNPLCSCFYVTSSVLGRLYSSYVILEVHVFLFYSGIWDTSLSFCFRKYQYMWMEFKLYEFWNAWYVFISASHLIDHSDWHGILDSNDFSQNFEGIPPLSSRTCCCIWEVWISLIFLLLRSSLCFSLGSFRICLFLFGVQKCK